MQTWKNKLGAIATLAIGYLGVVVEGDATALVIFSLFAIPLFFAKDNWVN